MLDNLSSGTVIILLVVTIAWAIESVTNRRALNQERLKIIEKGGDLNDLNVEKKSGVFSNNMNALKYGLAFIGIAVGGYVGYLFEQNNVFENIGIGYMIAISLFVGIALITNHYLSKNENKESK